MSSGFPCGSAGKESACKVGGLGSTPGLGKIPRRGERLPTKCHMLICICIYYIDVC